MINKNKYHGIVLTAMFISHIGMGFAADEKTIGQDVAQPILPKAQSPARLVTADKCQKAIVPGHNESPALLLLFAPLLQLIGSKAAGAVAGYGIEKTSDWLKSQKANLTASTTATFSAGFYDSDVSRLGFKCIEFVRGSLREPYFNKTIYDASVNEVKEAGFDKPYPGWTKEQLEDDWSKYKLSSLPELYLAFTIDLVGMPIPGKPGKNAATQFKVVPLEALYLKSGAKRNDGNGKKVTARVMISTMGDSGMKPIYDHLFDFGKLQFGKTTNLDIDDGPLALLPAPTAFAAAPAVMPNDENGKKKLAAATKSASGGEMQAAVYGNVPVTVTVIINELEDGGDFAGAIAAAAFDDEAKKKATDITQKAVSNWLGKALGVSDAAAAEGK
ncbi:hypothetical protein [Cupriavidus sp. D39]|uniref:hypothetical protein n=1 Tax=Cupriavidus sp. D39 TaxID=2997877 RepID=UPI00226F6AA2|nr:hypothetical protein [Cupriavidus sp. D39]MCY0854042.1 hypothetical protein [Cupriavidus sp. D39]